MLPNQPVLPQRADLQRISASYDPDPARSGTLAAEVYTHPAWLAAEREAIFMKTWLWICHVEAVRDPGSFKTLEVAGQPVVVLRNSLGELRCFFNVCKHRAHRLLEGQGSTRRLSCPYHAWTYDLDGRLLRAPHTSHLENFDIGGICLDPVRVEEFCGFIYLNFDAAARPLAQQSGALANELQHWAPDVAELTFGRRLSYDIQSNWKNVVDNFLECYHCPTAHRDFCQLVDMSTYKVTTHGIYSSHMAEAGNNPNSPYDVSGAEIRTHAVWWLWPTTCLMRYPGRSSIIVLNVIPVGPNRTLETYDFYWPTAEPNDAEREAIEYLDTVLQVEDINLVENVQRGMQTPAFHSGRIVHDPAGSGKSEHAVHHFHGLVLQALQRTLED